MTSRDARDLITSRDARDLITSRVVTREGRHGVTSRDLHALLAPGDGILSTITPAELFFLQLGCMKFVVANSMTL